MINQSDVTIIIPHLGADEQQEYAFDECIKSLKETVPDMQVVTFGNGNTTCKHGTTIRSIELQGQCKAVNAAVATTNTPWIFITNDDMIYAPGWWERLSEHQHIEGNLVMSSKLIEPRPGAPTFEVFFAGGAGGDFDKDKWLEFAKKYYEERDAITRPGFNLPFLISRELWDTIGGYDINYDPWGSNSDSDLEYKIMLAGALPIQDTFSIVYHFSQTSGTFNPENDSHRFKNYAYFKEKWGFDRTDDGIWEASFEIPTKEQGRIFLPEWEGKYK